VQVGMQGEPELHGILVTDVGDGHILIIVKLIGQPGFATKAEVSFAAFIQRYIF